MIYAHRHRDRQTDRQITKDRETKHKKIKAIRTAHIDKLHIL